MRANFVARIRLIAGVVALIALVLVVRLYGLEVMRGEEYRARASGQYSDLSSGSFDRGSIFFTDKSGVHVGAATIASGYILAINPREVVDADAAYTALAPLITIDHDTFMAKASKTTDPYEELAHRVPLEVGKAIATLEIPGVHVYRELWRLYPGGTRAAHTIGFVGYGSGDTLTGQYGLERLYNDALVKPTQGLYTNFFASLFADIKGQIASSTTRPGADVVTTIEPSTQAFAEDILNHYDAAWHPTEAGVIIMDPKTGAVVAMAATPTFDPNNLADANANAFTNPLTSHVYEFGSIMKPLTMAAGIDAGAVTPATTYNDLGYIVLDGSRINNFDGKGRGVVSMQEVLNQSLNTGVAYVVSKMGTTAFRTYLDRYGLRSETGIDLPDEAAPLVKNLESPRAVEYATVSFGQGFAVTPIAMTRALGVLANHGMVPSPHVGEALVYPGGITKTLTTAPQVRAISTTTAETVTRMLVTVVDTALRKGAVKIPEMSVAAKTGTAQIARPDAHGYYTDRYLHSFFGYFPAYSPRFIIFFYAVAPQGAQYASETWTDPFMQTVRFLTTYYDVPPDRATTEP